MPAKKIIIGLVGEAGSGKDTVADYLKEKCNAELFRFADPLNETLALFLDDIKRVDLTWLAVTFKKRFGKDVLFRGLRKKIESSDHEIIAVNGIRFSEDAEFIKSLPNAHILYITLDQKKRWERIYGRGEKADDAVSFETFQEMEKAETEEQIPHIGEKADFRLENIGNKMELFAKVNEIVTQIRKG